MRVFGLDRCVPGSKLTRRPKRAGGFTFSAESHAALVAAAEAAYPKEACGLVLGTRKGSGIDVREVHTLRNLASHRERFELDPGGIVRAEREARARGISIVAVWHSHPDAPAVPSRADEQGAWPGMAQIIVEVRSGRAVDVGVWARPSC